MSRLIPIQAQCPTCKSTEIFYTCHPQCCFNHVCNACKTTFELATRIIRKDSHQFQSVAEMADRDTTLPTAPCAECEGTNVFQVEGGETICCVDCRALLTLVYEKVALDS